MDREEKTISQLLILAEHQKSRRNDKELAWRSEILRPKGIDGANKICCLDTCVLVNIFLENEKDVNLEAKKRENIAYSIELADFEGIFFVISPFTMAEFIKVATNATFKLTPPMAREKLEYIMHTRKIGVIVPVIDLNSPPQLTLPCLDYSLKLTGIGGGDGQPIRETSMTFSYGVSYYDECITGEMQIWDYVVLSGALFNMYISMFMDLDPSLVGKIALQDLIVVSMARGQKQIDFVSTDDKLIDLFKTNLFPDVSVYHVKQYLKMLGK
jgi:hypothetical protein